MATKPRIYSAAGMYHVYNRGARRRDIFADDRDRHLFLDLLSDLVRSGLVICHASCLMGNHYHLLLEAPGTDVSTVMKGLAGQYVQKFNARYGFDGPMFRSRFGSTAIEGDEHLLETVRYIHNNPIDIGEDIRTYRWSSHPAYLGLAPSQTWLETSRILEYFNGDLNAYRSFVERTPYQWSAA